MPLKSISQITEIIADIKAGKMVILVDDESRENEGDFVIAAEFATAEHINFMAKFGRGLICLTLTEARCKQLNLPQMVEKNVTGADYAFCIGIFSDCSLNRGRAVSRWNTSRDASCSLDRHRKIGA